MPPSTGMDTDMANDSFKGKVAAVTGSTSGIGLEIAQEFAKAGADIAINGFGNQHEIDAKVAQLRGFGRRVEYFGSDMSKGAEAEDFVRQVLARLGSCDILVNNAGVQHVAPIETFPAEQWDKIIAINLTAAFHTIKAAIPGMKAKNWGRIINIASAHGLRASPYKSAYVAAKHGLLGLTKTAALELAETPITANSICPGFVKTSLVEGQIAAQAEANNMSEADVVQKIILASQPTHRFVETSEIAGTALFLAGPFAANITGAAISVDGGWTAR